MLLALVAVVSVAFLPACEPADDIGGQWGPVLDWNFQGKHAALLGNGKVLLWANGESAEPAAATRPRPRLRWST